ncbi:MAG TPA: hypothetical protein VFH51_09745 [Myxococcota bacterium]|nr:hypothetical protein [Myxococcota bacterium]
MPTFDNLLGKRQNTSPCLNGVAPNVVFAVNKHTYSVTDGGDKRPSLSGAIYADLFERCVDTKTAYKTSTNCGLLRDCSTLYPCDEDGSFVPHLIEEARTCDGRLVQLSIDFIQEGDTDPALACFRKAFSSVVQSAVNCNAQGTATATNTPTACPTAPATTTATTTKRRTETITSTVTQTQTKTETVTATLEARAAPAMPTDLVRRDVPETNAALPTVGAPHPVALGLLAGYVLLRALR